MKAPEVGLRILVIEDEPQTGAALRTHLRHAGHEVRLVSDGGDGLALGAAGGFDAAIVDRTLPTRDGLSVLREWRSSGHELPVLLLTARGDVADRVEGLRSGADDYLAKPFHVEEVLARVAAMTRRRRSDEATLLCVGDMRLDLVRRDLERAGARVRLQPRECGILAQLMRNVGSVVSRSMLLETVWGYGFDPGTNIVESHVSRLRAKLSTAGRDPIETMRGLGYRLCPR